MGESMKRVGHVLMLAVAAVLLIAVPTAGAQSSCSWMQGDKSPEQRANELIAAMTLDQKIHQVTFSNPPWMTYYGTAGHIDGTAELCIPTLVLSDAGSGVAGMQQGTTTFPSGVAQAATFNPELERRFGEALGQEAWNKGINIMLGPGMNIARIATNGRNFEYFGEDPFLAGKTAAAAIRGIQSNPVLAQAKHYAANNQETQRNTIDARIDERTLREIYLPAFERSIKEGRAASVMCAYNKLNGKYACENPELLDGYLRRDWHFDGFVTSDWGATHSTVESALAGLDMEMHAAPPQYYAEPLEQAVSEGKVPMARLDGMLRHIFVPMFRFGLFDKPPVAEPQGYTNDASTPEHRSLARRISQESTVLLKNDGGLLPLDHGTGRTIGVIGYAAGPGSSQTSGGGGSSKGSGVPVPVSPLEGIQRQAAAHGDRVLYADGSSQADAQAVAQASDIVIVVAADSELEGGDRPDLEMHPGVCPFPVCVNPEGLDQEAMIESAAAANPNTVVVISAGAPVAMEWLGKVKAVLDQWYAGVENGNALAAIIYGEANPSGKLPQTFPKRLEDMPARTPQQYPGQDGKAIYSEGLLVGYRWFDAKGIEPLFPFGFGLSYTTFRYSGLSVTPRGKGARVQFTVTNTGKRSGAESAQVYVGFPKADGEPPKQLKGFEKVSLEDGQSKTVTVDLGARAFRHWADGWVATRGCYAISVGASSRDLPLRGAVPIAGGRCGGASAKRCTSRRKVVVHLRRVRGRRIRSVAVYVNGTRERVRKGGGRRLALRFGGRAKGIVRVRMVVRTADGRKVVDKRTYHLCAKRRR
jgi:beta-glucosidase